MRKRGDDMPAVGQSLELGSYRLKILELLGGKKNLTYKTIDEKSGENHILRVIEKPTTKEAREGILAEKEELLKKFFEANEMLKEKYGSYCDEAGFEIFAAALQGQVIFEAKILKDYKHEGLSNLLFFTQDESAYYLILNYIQGRNLGEIIRVGEEIREENVLRWMKQTAGILKFLHTGGEEKILYNNLNPLNIIIDEKNDAWLVDLQKIKLFDPEQGRGEEWQEVLSLDSLPPYCPLEGYVNPQSEIYALGATFYELVTGKPIASAKSRAAHDTLEPLRGKDPRYSKKLSAILSLSLELSQKNRLGRVDSLLRAIEEDDFPQIGVECEGRDGKFIKLGREKGSFSRTMSIVIGKPIDDPAVIRINNFDYRWNLKPESDEPKLELKKIKEGDSAASAELVVTARELPPGIYEGVSVIDTNWGCAEISMKIEVMKEGSKTPYFITAGVIIWGLVIIAICLLFPANPYKKIKSNWNRDTWDHFNFTLPSYVIPRVNMADAKKWEVYQNIPGISIAPAAENLNISGAYDAEGFVRTGWISSFFLPSGTFSLEVDMDIPAQGPESAGIMLLSSNGCAASIEYSNGGKILRMASRIEEKWDFVKIENHLVNNEDRSHKLRLVYNMVNDEVQTFINEKKAGTIPSKIILDDIAIFLFVTLEKKSDKVDVIFRKLKVTAGPAAPRIPPYSQVTTGIFAIREKPDIGSARRAETLNGEKVIVQEEKGDWCRIRTISEGTIEGWMSRKGLRDLFPREIVLDL